MWLGLWALVLVIFFIGIVIAEVNVANWDDEYQDLLGERTDHDDKKNELQEVYYNGQQWRDVSSLFTFALLLWLGVLGVLLVLITYDD